MTIETIDTSLNGILAHDIIQNIITNDVFVSKFLAIPSWRGLIPLPWADAVIDACISFFRKYGHAPKKQYILDYLNNNQQVFRLSDEVLGSVISFIDNLEDSKEINAQYEFDNALMYLKRQALERTKNRIDAALSIDNVSLAEKALSDVVPSSDSTFEEIDVLDMDEVLQEAVDHNEAPLISMGGPFGSLVCPHIKSGKFVFFLATAKAGKTWCLYTLAAAGFNSGKNTLVFAAGDMDKLDNSIRIGHIMSVNDTASSIEHSGVMAYPVLDCILNQEQTCPISSNQIKLPEIVEKMTGKFNKPEDLMGSIPSGYSACDKCRTCPNAVHTWTYEKRDVQYRGWAGLNTHKHISKRRNGKAKFRIKICPSNTLTTKLISDTIDECAASGWVPELVVIDYADLMDREEGDNSREIREKENTRWKNLRKLSQSKYHPCVITVTQSNRDGYKETSLDATNVNEDRRKLDHATAIFSLNQTAKEKDFRIARVACIMARDKAPSPLREVVLLQAYESGKFVRGSFWRMRQNK